MAKELIDRNRRRMESCAGSESHRSGDFEQSSVGCLHVVRFSFGKLSMLSYRQLPISRSKSKSQVQERGLSNS